LGEGFKLEQMRIRNPKGEELGEVVRDTDIMENKFLQDGKAFYLQMVEGEQLTIPGTIVDDFYHILIRSWNPESWAFSPLHEIRIGKNVHASKFAQFIQQELFPRIELDNLFATKIHD